MCLVKSYYVVTFTDIPLSIILNTSDSEAKTDLETTDEKGHEVTCDQIDQSECATGGATGEEAESVETSHGGAMGSDKQEEEEFVVKVFGKNDPRPEVIDEGSEVIDPLVDTDELEYTVKAS